MTGGNGNDSYIFTNPTAGFENDVVKELAAGGIDTLDFTALSTPMISTKLEGTDLAQNAGRTVRVDQPGEQLNIEFAFNVNPFLEIDIAPSLGVPFMPLDYDINFFDVGTMMTHTAVVNWDDGSVEAAFVNEILGVGDVLATHMYDSLGIRNIVFTVTDNVGNSTDIVTQVEIDQFALLPDPKQPGKTALFVGGTLGNDKIVFSRSKTADIRAKLNGEVLGDFTFDGGIFAYSGPGNDKISMPKDMNRNALFDGGDDNDKLTSGRGDDMLMGGSGDDKLTANDGDDMLTGDDGDDRLDGGYGWDYLNGGANNDTLLGGHGNDILLGGSGDDLLKGEENRDLMIGGLGSDELIGSVNRGVLIGGTTLYDGNLAALEAIRAEISFMAPPPTGTAPPIDPMIFNLENGTGLNGPFVLDWGVTVFDDGAADLLVAKDGADWLIAFAGDELKKVSSKYDRVTTS